MMEPSCRTRVIFFDEVEKRKLTSRTDGEYFIPGRTSEYSRMFIVCFCEDGDLLSQWRGYGADQGYALGFDTAHIQELTLGELISLYSMESKIRHNTLQKSWKLLLGRRHTLELQNGMHPSGYCLA